MGAPHEALEQDLRRALGDAVDFSAQARALYATDASNYRQVPIGLVSPRNRDEVIETVRICREHDAPILPRGGGTSLAGQGCNAAVTIDFSRHLHRVVGIDPAARRATVEPGCILDRLCDEAKGHGLTFGPDPATHDHNTLGGMIGNDSCGVHSVTAGRTADNVERLTVLTYDGEVLELGPTREAELAAITAKAGRRGDIFRALVALRDRWGPLIEARYPKIPRLVSGYENLDALLPGRGFNVARSVVGTEGSCLIVLDATLTLVPHPAHKALALLGFDDVFAAADAVPSILAEGPDAIEGFDDKLFRAVRRAHAGHGGLALLPDGKGWLMVEAGGETRDEAEAKVRRIVKRSGHKGHRRILSGPDEQQRIWTAREASLGATAFVQGQPEHWPGWEDSAVPPDRLGDYLRDLEALFRRHGYTAAIYGHFGDGVIHCRIDFDFRSGKGLANYRAFMCDAAHLVHSYGGSLSGEHGDGQARAELLEIMYGPELLRCFREFKAIWDPGNRMNPGKAIEPYPVDSNLRLGPDYRPEPLETWFGYPADHGSFAHATTRCVGVGKCRRRQVGDEVMCPSYLATGEERHSTRGRAHLLHEMTRGEVINDGWSSDAVEDALSLCLACKGCKADCPVGVDVATWKAEFRAHHYKDRLRPRAAYSMGLIDRWARVADHAPGIANLLAGNRVGKWVAGIDGHATLPRFARQSFRRWFAERDKIPIGGERVLLWPDTFNNHFRPETAIAAVEVLERAGFEVTIPRVPLCCGRPLYDWGFLDQARARLERIFAALAGEIAAGTPVVGLEPACVSVFKDELPNLFPDRDEAHQLSKQVIYFADFVADRIDQIPSLHRGGDALVQVHCHHHAVIGFDKEKALLDRLSLAVERPPQGCCGMAGAFGMAAETHGVGRAIGERVLLPRVRELPADTLVLADGFSCREQIEAHGGRTTRHIAELLAGRLA
ncbi:putative oxidoreductase [Sphingomonas changbaiensis NBRC 104936]|uniref:Putative oxidoreductase n=1 Tax=Sphingomonas changbaiensis NBRC 104936 TaxID=1219043 RepID=A0A0E9MLQ9_9SPHN|nr:FAD-binding and (Fe-S)-binding domain-containing protein [Sphingomonas changbaiensis]GAO38459.1 putative oxidoreductase [Sphingomonas changbaiensis NBRC 104936]